MTGPAPVRVEGLTWRPVGARAPILTEIDLAIEAGERVLVTGPSGGGKSTLLRALAGVLATTEHVDLSGTVLVAGGPPVGGDVGLLVQDPADALVAPTAGRDVAFGLENRAVPRSQMPDRVAAALTAVGFPYGPERSPRALSGGEAQRLALAGVIAPQPGLLLLDEPTAMLDAASAATVVAAVGEVVRDRRTTLVVVEQQLAGWVELVDRIVVIADGRVVAAGPTEQILAAADDLTAHGVWVPGTPDPAPLRIDQALGRPDVLHEATDLLLRATDLTVKLKPARGLRVGQPRPTTLALAEVGMDVHAGKVRAVLGPSGAGKSTLLHACAGLVRPTSGEVAATPPLARAADVHPHAWTSHQLAERHAWVPQRASLTILGNTVAESATATAAALGHEPDRAQRLLEALGLAHLRTHNPHTLSGGETRRLALVSALAHGPEVLFLDEPTAGQDRHTWAAVTGVIAAAAAAGTAVVVATHDDLLATRADTMLQLPAGAVS